MKSKQYVLVNMDKAESRAHVRGGDDGKIASSRNVAELTDRKADRGRYYGSPRMQIMTESDYERLVDRTRRG